MVHGDVHVGPLISSGHGRAKFSSSGALFAKQRKRATGRSQGPSPHPASSWDGDGAQNATVLACCGLREARTRVRARAAYKVCVCVQYGTSEIVLTEPPPPAFPRFSCPEIFSLGFGAGGRLPIWHGVGGFVFNSSSSSAIHHHQSSGARVMGREAVV